MTRDYGPAWIRIEYGPGTDELHQKLLDAIYEFSEVMCGWHEHSEITVNDSTFKNTLLLLVEYLPFPLQETVKTISLQESDDIVKSKKKRPGDSNDSETDKFKRISSDVRMSSS